LIKKQSMNAKLKASIFTILFSVIGGAVIYKNFNFGLLPLVLFYVVLMIDTYFSIEFFSRIVPPKRLGQRVIDLLLVFFYLVLVMSFGNEVWYLLSATMLFVMATLKYVFLLGIVDLKILKKKMIIDILAGMVCILALGGYLIGWGRVIMWVWSLVFLLANIYILILKPVYKLDNFKVK
jgi:hypothetical protein